MINTFFIYLAQSVLSIAILWVAYKAFFANQSYFSINRIILLAIIGFGFFGPLVAATFYSGIEWANMQMPGGQIAGNAISNTLNEFIVRPGYNNNTRITILQVVLLIYVVGVALQFARFTYNLNKLTRLFIKSKKIKSGQFTYVLLPEGSASFSFFNWLFLDKSLLSNDSDSNQIITHEKIHSKQKHSIDILMLEFLLIWQWFNPFVYLLKKSVIENHEYLADRGTLNEMKDLSEYKLLLLQNILYQGNYALTNNFSYSLIKKRLKMMEMKKSKFRMLFTTLGFTMVFAIVTISCSNKIKMDEPNAQTIENIDQKNYETQKSTYDSQKNIAESNDEVLKVAEKMPEYPGGTSELFKFMGNNIKYPEQAKKENIEGKVFVNFIVEKDGSISNVQISQGIGRGCDEESIRVVNLMPNWTPGENNGEKVRVEFTLPINYKLN